MPLARLSIKSAIRFARARVTVAMSPDGTWTVRAHFPDGSPLDPQRCNDRKEARSKQREQRIFVALLFLGIESAFALPAALDSTATAQRALAQGRTPRPWREVVALHFERLSLSKNL